MFSLQTKMSILRAILTKKSPYYVQYYINSRCNLKCKQCNIVESNSDVREATLDEVDQIASNLRQIGGGIVLLTGGEPFLRKDLPEMVEIFRRHKLDPRLQTAGMRVATPEQLRRCYDAGARDLNISLDSLDPSKQEYINSVPGSWHTAIQTISWVSEVFQESAICSLGCVLSRFNFAEIPHILRFATEIGWYLSLVPVHITDPSLPMGFRSYEEDFRFRSGELQELEEVFARLISMRRQGYKLFDSEDFLRSSLNFIKTGRPTWRKNNVCDSPFLYFAIRPNGDMAVCCDHRIQGRPVSLLDPDFPKIYHSREFVERVLPTTVACGGCHYGSYPEVTISVRSPKALLERILLTMRSAHRQLRSYSYEEMLAIIDRIKAEAAPLYDKKVNLERYNNNIILEWESPEAQKDLQRLDRQKRTREGRVRLHPRQQSPAGPDPASPSPPTGE